MSDVQIIVNKWVEKIRKQKIANKKQPKADNDEETKTTYVKTNCHKTLRGIRK